jgi:hypothetical protein
MWNYFRGIYLAPDSSLDFIVSLSWRPRRTNTEAYSSKQTSNVCSWTGAIIFVNVSEQKDRSSERKPGKPKGKR